MRVEERSPITEIASEKSWLYAISAVDYASLYPVDLRNSSQILVVSHLITAEQ